MKCPYCDSNNDMVIDSRPLDASSVVRRRRECVDCHKRYTTYERLEMMPITVVKRDGRREPFDRNKIRDGVLNACRKRPIPVDTIEKIINDIEYELQDYVREVKSSEIGDKIIEQLKNLDEVAYVRFVSVYKQFDSVSTFLNEIEKIKQGV
ncbi:MAG: transcriptional regulator NrdR [Elusimicrobiota bacterium]